MNLNLPRPVNPNAAEDVAEGRQMAADVSAWLDQLDQLLDGED